MNEEQRLQAGLLKPDTVKTASAPEKDYSKYFETVYTPPSLKEAKKRGKEEIAYHDDFKIEERFLGMGAGRKFYIRTYGCQMNEHDTEVMAGIFTGLGYEATDTVDDADVILLNTCAIRENAENKVFGELGHLKPLKLEKPDLLIGVCGCMSQEESVVNKILKTYDQVDMIFGTHNIHRLPNILHEAYLSKEMVVEVWSKEGDIIENLPKVRHGNIKAWVNIMYGCDKFCTYCIVPYTRGKERSRRPQDIIQEVRQLAAHGYKEIMLLGQNVNAYGKDFDDIDYRLGDLMDDLRQIDIPRIRFTTSHPRDFDDHLIEVLAKGGNLLDHIHLPVQSGSSEILKIMARKYSREQFLELVAKIKAAIPNVTLTTDIIVGFPNETDEQFEETLSLYKEVGFEMAYTYIYSPREGTPAAKMVDNIPMEVKKERLQRLNKLVNDMSAEAMKPYKGKIVKVLVEGESKRNPDVLAGYTEKNKLVNFKAPRSVIGEIVNVKITEAKTWSLDGEFIGVVKQEKGDVIMEKLYTKDEIVEKAREIAHMIANTEQVEFFKRAEEQINENQKIREKIASLKSLQTQAVNFQMYEKERALAIIEEKIEKIQGEIDEVPIVQEFKQSQTDVNQLLQLVSNTIANCVTDEIIESTGGDVRRGETGSYVRNTQHKPLQ